MLGRWGRQLCATGASRFNTSQKKNNNSLLFASLQRYLHTIPVPSMGDSISEGTVVEWVAQVGDQVAVDDVVAVLETDKVSVDVRTPVSGTLKKQLAEVDDVVEVGALLAELDDHEVEASSKTAAATPVPPPAEKQEPASAPAEPTTSTPKEQETAAPKAPAPPAKETNQQPSNREIRREKMSRMRLRIAERLKESQNVAASLTTFQEVDMKNLIDLRKTYKDSFEKAHGVKLGFMSAFVKASASALMAVPAVNAEIDEETSEIIYRDFVDMSVAVSTPKGLVTPVLKDVHTMSFADIEKTLAELALRARDGNLALEEMTGGHFTISNGGVFGSLMGTPILNRPQSAILGMHATKPRPVVVDGEVVVRPMMYLALTYDHRIIDGREAVTCLKSIADQIQDPQRLLLEL